MTYELTKVIKCRFGTRHIPCTVFIKTKMKFISAAPVLFTTTVLVAWNATPVLSAKVKASATINDKVQSIH
jgi:hypothetical protein